MSTTGSQQVKRRIDGKEEVVGTATFLIYDSISEAIESIGEEKSLELLNAQVKTNAMNTTRAESREPTSNKALTNKAMEGFTADDWLEIAQAGGAEASRSLLKLKLDAKIAELKAQLPEEAAA